MDIVALDAASSIDVSPIFDTQIAMSTLNPSLYQCSLNQLLLETIHVPHPGKDHAPHLKDVQFWWKRPLSQQAIEYASADVELLLD